MKIKNFDKISGYTYKGFSIVNPIHNADETKYEATILNLNSPHKPKWELSVITSEHKFIIGDSAKANTFFVILRDDEGRSTTSEIHKDRMKSISIFRNTFEEMIDKLLSMRLTASGVTYSSHSLSRNPNKINSNTISGILSTINKSGTLSIYDASTGKSIDLIDTIKGLQKQIEELKDNNANNT